MRKLHIENHRSWYAAPDTSIRMTKSRKLRWSELVAQTRETISAYRILVVGKLKAGKTTWESRRRWKDIIKMDLEN